MSTGLLLTCVIMFALFLGSTIAAAWQNTPESGITTLFGVFVSAICVIYGVFNHIP